MTIILLTGQLDGDDNDFDEDMQTFYSAFNFNTEYLNRLSGYI